MCSHHFTLIIDVTGALIISTLAAKMLNLGTSGASFETLIHTGILMAAASVLSSVCAILGGYACASLSARVGKDMRVALYKKSLKLSIYDFRHLEQLPSLHELYLILRRFSSP